MKITISESQFIKQFEQFGRVGVNQNFSYSGLRVLFEYLEELEQGLGEEIELDPIGLCCDYSELTHGEALSDYDVESIDELRDETLVLDVDDETVIVQAF